MSIRSIVPRREGRGSKSWLAVAGCALGLLAVLPGNRAYATHGARERDCRSGLRFGIYPGGTVGTVAPAARPAPPNPAKQLAALKRLRAPGRPFVLHLYASFTGPGSTSARRQLSAQVRRFTRAGFDVELVLAYRPSDGGSAADVPSFAGFAADAVRAFGANPRFVSLQITNEPNVGGAADVNDGSYADVEDALIAGVLAAHTEIHADRFGQVKVGFNWAYSLAVSQRNFWAYLRGHGGPALAGALDWVGLDAYPGTWGPRVATHDLAGGIRRTVVRALALLRRHMRSAGIPHTVRLHVSENGYPTGPGRSDAMQTRAMQAAVAAVDSVCTRFGVTGYRWFDLRDADSGGSGFEDHYGLLRSDYQPKPAFAVYRRLVALQDPDKPRK